MKTILTTIHSAIFSQSCGLKIAFFSLARGPSASTNLHRMKTSQQPRKSLHGEPGCRVIVRPLNCLLHCKDPVLAQVEGATRKRSSKHRGQNTWRDNLGKQKERQNYLNSFPYYTDLYQFVRVTSLITLNVKYKQILNLDLMPTMALKPLSYVYINYYLKLKRFG